MAIPKKGNNPDDFISGAKATQADQQTLPKKKNQNKAEKEVSYLLKMPESLRLKLKIKAVEQGQSMNSLICKWIKNNV